MSRSESSGSSSSAVMVEERETFAPQLSGTLVGSEECPEQIGPYRVIGQLGEGGMGEVYDGFDDRLKRPVALKRLRAESGDEHTRTRFRNEARAVARLSHAAIVQVYDWVEDGDCAWIVMERVEGRPLGDLLDGPLAPERAARLGRDVAAGLAVAHAAGIVHRDLKVANVMVTNTGRAKILDFGIAKILPAEAGQDLTMVTEEGLIVGTVSSMSPEQAVGDAVDPRSDLFALGTLLYRMTTGVMPFRGRGPVEVLTRICTSDQKPAHELNPAVPPTLSALIERLLRKEPDRRPQSAEEVVEALEQILSWSSSRTAIPFNIRENLTETVAGGGVPGLAEESAALREFMESDERRALSSSASGALHPGAGTEVPIRGSETGTIVAVPQLRRRWSRLAVVGLVLAAAAVGTWWIWQGQSPAGLAGIESLVAIPSQVMDDVGEPYLADAIPSTLSTQLGRVEGLEVKLPPTSLDVERVGGDLSKIIEAYRVDAMILSTVGTEAGHLVLNLQLVDAISRNLLWSQEYVGQLSGYLGLARQAAEGVRLALRPGAQALRPMPMEPAGSQVELLLQQGRYHSNLYRNLGRPGDRERALAVFDQAFELDSRSAAAAAEIAMLHAASLSTGVSLEKIGPEIKSWAERALELDPRSSKAWSALGEAQVIDQPESLRQRLTYALRAANFGPRDSYAHSRLTIPLARGSYTLALAAAEQASSVDPLILISPVFEALCYLTLGQNAEALARVEEALAIEPEMPYGLWTRASSLIRSGREREALDLISERLEPLAKGGQIHPLWLDHLRDQASFSLAIQSGATDRSEPLIDQLSSFARGETPFPRWVAVTGGVSTLLAEHGQITASVELLAARAEMGHGEAFDRLLFHPSMALLRGDPTFERLIADSRARFEAILAVLEQARAAGEMPSYLEAPLVELRARIDEEMNRWPKSRVDA